MRDKILAYANWPDISESDNCLFIGHFYNPVKKVSYNGSDSVHALNRFNIHLNAFWPRLQKLVKIPASRLAQARDYFPPTRPPCGRGGCDFIESLQPNQELLSIKNEIEEISIHIGSALHYMADMAMPYHAKNVTAPISLHTPYERDVRLNQDKYLTRNYEGTLPIFTGDFFGDMDNIALSGSRLAYDSYDALFVDPFSATRIVLYKNQRMVAEFFYLLFHYI
ncbi:MAG: hypothetical protein HQK51_08285 [Oligoflexia bacterium]|nr:hypothetical protein [Oligoflexia bacterium]